MPVIAVQRYIAAVAEVDQPFPIFRLCPSNGPPNFGVTGNGPDSGTNRFDGPLGYVYVFLGQKMVGTLKIARKTQTKLHVAFGWLHVLSFFQLGKPGVHLFHSQMQARGFVFVPRSNAVL